MVWRNYSDRGDLFSGGVGVDRMECVEGDVEVVMLVFPGLKAGATQTRSSSSRGSASRGPVSKVFDYGGQH